MRSGAGAAVFFDAFSATPPILPRPTDNAARPGHRTGQDGAEPGRTQAEHKIGHGIGHRVGHKIGQAVHRPRPPAAYRAAAQGVGGP
ncbi:hypothetical protein GCM10009548_47090 [Streptomyces malaysiensis subsp. malaysiensis]